MATPAAAPIGPGRARRRALLKRAENRFGFLLAVPALIAFCVVILYPFLQAIWLSFYRVTIFAPEPKWVGFNNFITFLTDPSQLKAWGTTVLFVVVTTSVTFVLGLIWALLMDQSFRGRAIVRSASLLPWVLPSTVTAFLWTWLLNAQYGVLNAFLLQLGIIDEPVAWLSTPSGAMAGIVIAKTWLSIPLFMAFFLAGLQSLSRDQLEAARVDGATNFQALIHVVLPHLKHTMMVVLVLGAMGNLQQFDVIYAMTGGGPVGATNVLSIEVYRQAFQNWNLGMAATVGVMWFLTIAPPAFIYLRSLFKN